MLNPIGAEVYLKYGCSECGAEHIVRRSETIWPGGILCGCNNKLKFRPIHKIRVEPIYEQQNVRVSAKPNSVRKPTNNTSNIEVVAALRKLGYSVKDALSLIKNQTGSPEDILKKVLSNENIKTPKS